MPEFQSEAQRRYMWKFHPRIAHMWAHGRSSKTGKKEFTAKNRGLPYHKRKTRNSKRS